MHVLYCIYFTIMVNLQVVMLYRVKRLGQVIISPSFQGGTVNLMSPDVIIMSGDLILPALFEIKPCIALCKHFGSSGMLCTGLLKTQPDQLISGACAARYTGLCGC